MLTVLFSKGADQGVTAFLANSAVLVAMATIEAWFLMACSPADHRTNRKAQYNRFSEAQA